MKALKRFKISRPQAQAIIRFCGR
ncbi:MAG: hypothetical protein IPJ74_22710 [Saprospiraceae bacterium]|nr:hypothetical protein [Saprospiraceae bacterium]